MPKDYGSITSPRKRITPVRSSRIASKKGLSSRAGIFCRVAFAVQSLIAGIFLNAEFTLLVPELAAAENLTLSYGTRARLQSLLPTNTLVLVRLSNSAFKSGALDTEGLFLVDQNRNQYNLVSTLDADRGAITARLVPATNRQEPKPRHVS